ncbi:MAG TPA: magnesium transporter [Thermoanaerobaculia bacterium]|nr:magnesium transporter [Thermoanaerobaculia bacterium]
MTAASASGVDTLARVYLRQFPEDAARHLESARLSDAVALLESEPTPHAVAVQERLASNVAADILEAASPDFATRVLAAMDPVRAAATVSWLDESKRESMLSLMDERAAGEVRAMAEYPPDTAGRLMDPRVMAFRQGTTVHEALARLRDRRRRAVADVFITDDAGHLSGRVPLQDLAVAQPDETLDKLAVPAISVRGMGSADEVVEELTTHKLASLPVVDFDGRLLGVIRHDVLMNAARQDVAADIQAMVGASREERALSRIGFAVRARLPWLEINLVTAFLAAAVVGLFESTIAQFTALAVLLPVVAGQSGNTGAQALAVTMRGLALREIRVAQWARVMKKEAMVAFINGWAIALTTAAGVFVWSRSVGLSLVIGSSMVISMAAAGVAGAAIPIVLTSIGRDPAQSSSIILTTITDVVGFFSFLGIATLLAGML